MKKNVLVFFLVLTLGIGAGQANAEASGQEKALSQYIHTQYRDKGFKEVLCILQDKIGYIWLGTYSGLVRFDGTDFDMFNQYTRSDFPVNSVRTLAEDKLGRLWIGTNDGGIVVYDKDKCDVYDMSTGLPNNSVRELCVARSGEIWIGTARGLCKYDGKSIKPGTQNPELKSALINFIREDKQGCIWVGTNTRGGLFCKEKKASEFTMVNHGFARMFSEQSVDYMLEDSRRNALWFIADGCAYMVSNGAVIKTLDFKNSAEPGSMEIRKAYADKNGDIWFINNLVRYSDRSITYFGRKGGLSGSKVTAFLQDREGNLWMGNELGLDKFSEPYFTMYGQSEGLSCPVVNAVVESKPGEYWLGTDDGVSILDTNQGVSFTNLSEPLLKTRIRHLAKDSSGIIWVGTYGNGLVAFHNGTMVKNLTTRDGLVGNKIRVVVEDGAHRLWVGTTTGISVIHNDGSIRNISVQSGLTSEYIMCLCEDKKGRMWVGTDGGGIAVLRDGKVERTYSEKDGLASDVILRFYQDRNGEMWATTTNGITRFKAKVLTTFEYGELGMGMADSVFQILGDSRDKMWMIADSGVYCIDSKELKSHRPGQKIKSLRFYRSSQTGLGEGPTPTAWAIGDHRGCFWIPTYSGVSAINPEKVYQNKTPPVPVVKKLVADNKVMDSTDGRFELTPETMRMDLSYAVLSFVDPENNLTRYKLEGVDKDWSDFSHRQGITYTNLGAGTYIFKVEAMNSDGVVSRNTAQMVITKLPHFYETNWFRFLVALVMVLIIVIIFRIIQGIRLRQLTEKLEKQEVLLELEKRATEVERTAKEMEIELNRAITSFVPMAFLNYLGKENILQIRPGDHVEQEITVLFADIRSFTQMSETMESAEIFQLLNNYLHLSVDCLTCYNGFIDKFIGDAIMGLFPGSPDDAVMATIDLYRALRQFNESPDNDQKIPIRIGAGIHHGSLTLGTVGTRERMDTTVIGDIVNLASRLQEATKLYGVDIIISDTVYNKLESPERFCLREIDTVRVQGKHIATVIYEVFDGDELEIQEKKKSYLPDFLRAIALYKQGSFDEANAIFQACQAICPEDSILPIYVKRCSILTRIPPQSNWAGISGL